MAASDGNRLTRIYTKSGDKGTTRLVGGQTVSKSDRRLDAYGTVDELSSAIGVARELNDQRGETAPARTELDDWLRRVQNELFHIGADLATRTADRFDGMKAIGDVEIRFMEERMDAMNEELGPLKDFILPGGGPLGAQLHVARTICRRAERHTVALSQSEDVEARVTRYLNRLSDYLFVLARFAALRDGRQETIWER